MWGLHEDDVKERQGGVRMASGYHGVVRTASAERQDSVIMASGYRHQDLMACQGVNQASWADTYQK